MAKTFKVGDKVRIVKENGMRIPVGTVLPVAKTDLMGVYLDAPHENGRYKYVLSERIELVDAKPTKKQRIKALENEVEALKARIEALEKAKEIDISARIAEKKTPNQRRKAVIERAKAFVADVEKGALCNDDMKAEIGVGNRTYSIHTTKPEYHVNKEKRVVTVLIKGANYGRLFEKAIARCAPGDVFNEHIGKAIALAKAYGLECPKEFTDAPQPEPAVGQLMEIAYIGWGGIFGIDTPDNVHFDGEYFALSKNGRGLVDGCGTKTAFAEGSKILDDTEAQYD